MDDGSDRGILLVKLLTGYYEESKVHQIIYLLIKRGDIRDLKFVKYKGYC